MDDICFSLHLSSTLLFDFMFYSLCYRLAFVIISCLSLPFCLSMGTLFMLKQVFFKSFLKILIFLSYERSLRGCRRRYYLNRYE